MRALVLQGGGAKGAYQAGALQYLLGELNRTYDLFCGTSVGAINAACVAQYGAREGAAAAHNLQTLWKSLKPHDVYRKWCLWPLSVPWKSSIYNSAPLRRTLARHISAQKIASSGNTLCIGAVSLASGRYTTWCETDPDLLDGILASSAFPGGLTPVHIRDQWYIDGGVRDQTPLNQAIQRGATVCDVVLLSSPGVAPVPAHRVPKTLDVLVRSLDILLDEAAVNDLAQARLYNQLVAAGAALPSKREIVLNVLSPVTDLGSTLNFDPKRIQENLLLGYQDAKRCARSWD